MAKLEWNKPEDRKYDSGIDRGVFYPKDGITPPIPWNGLTSVKENAEGASLEPVYQNGYVQAFDVSPGRFKAVLDCFSYPDEFGELAVGESELWEGTGLFLNNQEIGLFNLSWRSFIADASTGEKLHYKIHFIFDALAIPSEKEYVTVSDSSDLASLSFDLDAVPQEIEGRLPTAHFVIDTRKMHPTALAQIEEILYGTEENDPRSINFEDFEDLINQVPPVVAENLFPNPSLESSNANAGAVFSNYLRNPFGDESALPSSHRYWALTDWGDYGGVSGEVQVQGEVEVNGVSFPKYWRKRWSSITTENTITTFGLTRNSEERLDLPGDTTSTSIFVSLYWRCSIRVTSVIVLVVFDANHQEIGRHYSIPETETYVPGTWVRIEHVFSDLEPGRNHYIAYQQATTMFSDRFKYNDTFDVTGGMIVTNSKHIIPFFAGGSMCTDPDFTSEYFGSEETSLTRVYYDPANEFTSIAGFIGSSNSLSLDRERSGRLIQNVNFPDPPRAILANSGSSRGMLSGETYRVTVYMVLTREFEVEPPHYGLVFRQGSTTYLEESRPENIANIPQKLSIDVTIPSSGAWSLEVMAPYSGFDSSVYIDKISIVHIDQADVLEFAGGYFDGFARHSAWSYGTWKDEADNSISQYRSFDFDSIE